LGDKSHALYKNYYCSPCLTVYNEKVNVCRHDNMCCKDISVNEAFKALRGYLCS